MRGCVKIIAGALLIISISYNSAFTQFHNYRFSHLKAKDGFTSSAVLSILKDSKGFMWFATGSGLYRYDGYNFKVYLNDPLDSMSISQNLVWCLLEDIDGSIWAGTHSMGLNKFCRITETFKRYLPNSDTAVGVNGIFNTYQDNRGTIWTTTPTGGLSKYIHSTDSFISYRYDTLNFVNYKNVINCMYEDSLGIFWVGTWQGLIWFDREKLEYAEPTVIKHVDDVLLTFGQNKYRPVDKDSIISDLLNEKYITTIKELDDQSIWFGTTDGLIQFDRLNNQLIIYQNSSVKYSDYSSLYVEDFIFNPLDGFQSMWISAAAGLNILNFTNNKITNYIHDPFDDKSLAYSSINKIFFDNQNLLWIGIENSGVDLVNVSGSVFEYYPMKPQKENDNPYTATSFCEDQFGNTWVGSSRGGLFKYNKNMDISDNYDFNPEDFPCEWCNFIYTIYEDPDGHLWVGSFSGGLHIYNRNNNRFDQCKFYLHGKEIYVPRVNEIIKDTYGWYWVGSTNISGLSYSKSFTENNMSFTKISSEPMEYNDIRDFWEDKSGNLWIAGGHSGIYILKNENRDSLVFSKYISKINDTTIIDLHSAFAFYGDKNDDLWIGSGQGLFRHSFQTGYIEDLTKDLNISNHFIYDIHGDDLGNLWLSTDLGLVRYNNSEVPERKTKILSIRDGAPFEEIYTYKFYIGKSGKIYVGGKRGNKDGFYRFSPQDLIDNTEIPPIVITDFQVKNKPFELDSNITEKKYIQLRFDENFFSFEFAALDFVDPSKNKYQYFLKGVDDDWIYSGTRRIASYTSVPPGDYLFRVKGSNNDGYWNEEGTSVAITILPPPWKTWWAYSIYVLFLAGIIYSIFRYYLKRQQLLHNLELEHYQAEKLVELDKMKSRFFANISHEFRTPLTLILGPLEKLRSKIKDYESEEELNIIQRNALRLQNLINQLLSLSKLESGQMKLRAQETNIVSLVNNCVQSFESLAKSKNIELNFQAEEKNIVVFIDRDKLEKIIFNLLSNAFKFTGEGGIVQVKVGSKQYAVGKKESKDFANFQLPSASPGMCVLLKISDTGRGIPSEKLPHIFDRFYQADQTYTKDQEGSGIGLALTKELVELHHGKISVESKLGKGTTFTIWLPMGKEHLRGNEWSDIIESSSTEARAVALHEPEIVVYLDENKNKLAADAYEKDDGKPLLLIVEDNDDLRSYIRSYLMIDYKIHEATDGEKGLAKAIDKIPDLVISDVMMPKMDGMELCKKLKTDERTSHIPVILLTAKAALEDRLEGLETGADDFITKPFDPQELQVRVKNLIKQRKKLQQIFSNIIGSPEYLAANAITSMDKKFIQKVTEVIERNLQDAEFKVEHFGIEMNMSRMQLHRKLKALTNYSPGEYIRFIRLNKAAVMLKENAGNIAEIAYDVGFNNPSYFSECFKKQFGKLPSDFIE